MSGCCPCTGPSSSFVAETTSATGNLHSGLQPQIRGYDVWLPESCGQSSPLTCTGAVGRAVAHLLQWGVLWHISCHVPPAIASCCKPCGHWRCKPRKSHRDRRGTCRLQQRQRLRERREANRLKEGGHVGTDANTTNGCRNAAEVKAREATADANAQVHASPSSTAADMTAVTDAGRSRMSCCS